MAKTKADLVEHIAKTCHLRYKNAHKIVSEVFTWIKHTVLTERMSVKIHYFGTFFLKMMKRSVDRNPKTGEFVITPERCGIAFHRSKRHAQTQKETDESRSD